MDDYLYILDYSDSTISKIILKEEDKNLETEDILNRYGFNIDECYFMFSNIDIKEIIVYND